ncbi:MAG: hypothetical protein GIKADHBN_00433 [Phycisphaerales bacterium]|nr:hypothetical protein [Phycisphaerales bacterium]
MLDAALQYAVLGYSVFPCWPDTKDPMTTHGFKDATTDAEQIKRWWKRTPGANVAIATDGLLVVDVDGKDNKWLSDQPDRLAELVASPTAATPRGGRHFLFRQPEGRRVSISSGDVAHRIDIRADGGYLVVAPSVVNSKVYSWAGCDFPPARDDLPLAPEWLLEVAIEKPRKQARRIASSLLKSQGPIAEGERNSTLTSLAGCMRRRGLDEAQILDALRGINDQRCRPTLGDPELQSIARSIGRYPAGQNNSGSTAPNDEDLPEIMLGPKEHAVTDEMVRALAADPELYQRGGTLVRTLRGETTGQVGRAAGSLRIAQVARAHLRERMTKYANIVKRMPDGTVNAAHPSAWLVQAVEARGEWPGIRELIAVSDTPFLRPDGSICQDPGYDPDTHVLYQPTVSFPEIPSNPTLQDALAALALLQDLVCDFRFEAPEHFSTWIASMLTVVARQAIFGPTPIFVVDANVRGAGKGLLLQISGQIVLGRDLPVSSYSHDNEEMRKKITSIAMAGDQVVLLDNIDTKFGNGAVDRAATCTAWKDRLLGSNQQVDLPLTTVWFATGNNVRIAADTARRVLPIRLDVLEERPEERTDFKYPDVLGYARQNRPRLLVALLTALRAYAIAGFPRRQLKLYGSYEAWSNLVRQAVVWLGLTDPCQGRDRLVLFSDTTAETLSRLIDAWSTYDAVGTGIVFAELVQNLYPPDRLHAPTDEPAVAMRAALEQLVGTPPGKAPTARQVANKIAAFRRRVAGGRFLDFNPMEYNRAGAVWRLHQAPCAADAASLRLCDSG